MTEESKAATITLQLLHSPKVNHLIALESPVRAAPSVQPSFQAFITQHKGVNS